MVRTPDGLVARNRFIHVRLTPIMEEEVDSQRAFRGGMSRSTYIRWLISQDKKRIEREEGKK